MEPSWTEPPGGGALPKKVGVLAVRYCAPR